MKHHVFAISEVFDGNYYHLRASLLRAVPAVDYETPANASEYRSVRNPERFSFQVNSQATLSGETSEHGLYAIQPRGDADAMEGLQSLAKIASKLARAGIPWEGRTVSEYVALVADALGVKYLAFRGTPNVGASNWGYSAHNWDFLPLAAGIARLAAMEATWRERDRKRA